MGLFLCPPSPLVFFLFVLVWGILFIFGLGIQNRQSDSLRLQREISCLTQHPNMIRQEGQDSPMSIQPCAASFKISSSQWGWWLNSLLSRTQGYGRDCGNRRPRVTHQSQFLWAKTNREGRAWKKPLMCTWKVQTSQAFGRTWIVHKNPVWRLITGLWGGYRHNGIGFLCVPPASLWMGGGGDLSLPSGPVRG
jgi:hypothetical protein